MPEGASKAKGIGNVVLRVLLAVLFLFAGGTKLVGMEMHVEHFAKWGYPDWFRLVVGAVETVSAILLLVPKMVPIAMAALAVVMVGAVGTHLTHEEAPQAVVPAVILALLGLLAYLRRAS